MNILIRPLFLLLLLIAAATATAQQRFEGELSGASGLYRIDVPAGWTPGGRLIIYNHGLTMQQPEQTGFPRTAPSTEVGTYWLGEGYALAAGTYSSRAWSLFDIEREQRALLAEFRRVAGEPGEILLVGGSLGGLVSLHTAESFHAEGVEVAGVYSLCAPAAGARSWDAAVDARLLFDAVCEASPLPPGSAHLPWVVDYSAVPSSIDNIEDFDDLEILAGVVPVADQIRRCTGFFQPRMLDTAEQLARRERLKELNGITSDHFLRTLLAYSIYPLADLIQAPEKLAGHNAFDNRFVDYGDPLINQRILRVERDPLAAVKLRAQSDLTGRVGGARVLAIHTDRDELVIPEHLSTTKQIGIPTAQLATALIAEAEPAHCRFSAAEFSAGFEGLRRWIDAGSKPTAESLRTLCETAAGSLGGEQRCGFDPTLEAGPLDSRIRPRNLALHQVTAAESGAWFDPATDGEGAIIEFLDQHTAVIAWYSYPASGEAGDQSWLIGLGRVTADGIHANEMRQYSGARFGAAFDPADIDGDIWGEMTFWSEGCNQGDAPGLDRARLRYSGPPGYGSGERSLRRLTHLGARPTCQPSTMPLPHPASRHSGSWYRGQSAPGEGLQFQVDSNGNAVLVWYTFSPDGRPAWLIGTASAPAAGAPWVFQMQRPRGTRFGAGFDPAAVQRQPWGELRLQFTSCSSASLAWTPVEAGWGAGSMPLVRLTTPPGAAVCSD
jgi:hypothetical protein